MKFLGFSAVAEGGEPAGYSKRPARPVRLDALRRAITKFWAQDATRAALLLVFILNACFFQCIWGTRTLLESARDAPSITFQGAWEGNRTAPLKFNKVSDPGAPAWASEPWLALIRDQYFHEHTLPLWDPHQGFGKALAANMQSQPFYPLTLALCLHLTPRTYNLYILFRLLIAGFCAYLYLRLFVSFAPALAGGITSMLAGYYVLFITMPHLSVETLLPAIFLSAESLMRQGRFRNIVFFAVIVSLTILGGMPESAILALIFLFAYVGFRVISDATLRHNWLAHTKRFTLATGTGIGLSAFFVLPFVGYVQRSWTSHGVGAQRGLAHDTFNSGALTYVFPMLFGPVNSSTLASHQANLRNYIGLIALFFVLCAIACLFRRERSGNKTRLDTLTAFFLFSTVLIVAKRYGLGVVNAIGFLPIFEQIDFLKYQEPNLSFSLSVLCAIGVERLIKRDVSGKWQALAIGISFVLLCFGLYQSRMVLSNHSIEHTTHSLSRVAVELAALLLALLAMCLVWRPTRQRLGFVAVTLLSLELTLSYIVPTYYLFNRLARSTSNPFAGAPFIDFLKSHVGDYRIFARDGVLMPNWASAFGLSDIRDLDAMYNQTYFPFLRAFFPSWQKYSPDLLSCFRGLGDYSFADASERRLLQLSSVRYLATVRPYSGHDAIIEAILTQNKGETLVGRQTFQIGGVVRDTLSEPPPHERLPFNVRVPELHPILQFSYGMDFRAFDKPGDGVGFTVECRDRSGRVTKLFSQYIDPKHRPDQRRWMEAHVDLTALRGKWIELLFSTDPGPKGNSQFDWAGWSNIRFNGLQPAALDPFRLVFEGDVDVFEYDDILPRAAVFYGADLGSTEYEALAKLAAPSFNVFQRLVVTSSQINTDEIRAIRQLNGGLPRSATAANITSRRSQYVQIEAKLDRPGILMLNDTADPDWVAKVDGRAVRWFPADYIFRGVLLQPGTHIVEFLYRPFMFYLGSALSAVTLLVLLALGSRRRPWITEPPEGPCKARP